MKNAIVAIKSLLVVVAVPFVVVACCSGVEDPDDQLTVEVDEATASGADDVQTENRCDADVVARDEDGAEFALAEDVRDNSDGSTRCVYVGTVDPAKLYTVEVKRGEQVGTIVNAESNPACSVRTDSADTDGNVLLQDPAPQAKLYGDQQPTTPATELSTTLSR